MSWRYLNKPREISEEQAANILLSPVITEKSTRLAANNQHQFYVARTADKASIKAALEKVFKVKVVQVRTINQRGKRKRFRNILGKRPDFKKAYVKLAEGSHLDFELGS